MYLEIKRQLIIYGVDMEFGANNIAVGQQKYATSQVAYDSASATSTTYSPGEELELNLPKTTFTSSPQTTDIWWGIEIPASPAPPLGTYTGTTTFEAKKNEATQW